MNATTRSDILVSGDKIVVILTLEETFRRKHFQSLESPVTPSRRRFRIPRAVKTVLIVLALIPIFFLLASLFNTQLSINLLDVGDGISELPQTGVEDLIRDVWVNEAGDTMLGDLVFYNADLHIGTNSLVTAASDLSSEELDLLNEGIDYDEIIG